MQPQKKGPGQLTEQVQAPALTPSLTANSVKLQDICPLCTSACKKQSTSSASLICCLWKHSLTVAPHRWSLQARPCVTRSLCSLRDLPQIFSSNRTTCANKVQNSRLVPPNAINHHLSTKPKFNNTEFTKATYHARGSSPWAPWAFRNASFPRTSFAFWTQDLWIYKVSNSQAKGTIPRSADSQTTYSLDLTGEKKSQLSWYLIVCICLLSSLATKQQTEHFTYCLVINPTLVKYQCNSYANITHHE